MKRELVPILEFDDDREAFIEPSMVKANYKPIHKKVIVSFFKDAIEVLLEDEKIVLFQTIKGEMDLEIYNFVDEAITLVPGKLGAPACAGFYEELIALGAEEIIFCGGGGVLKPKVALGHLIVIDSAIRDEGFSYHYLPPSREVKANQAVVQIITDYLAEHEIEYIVGKAWTTDAFFRETKAKIKARVEEGAVVVEMEQAAMLAVSTFRNVRYGAIIYGGDDLSGKTWDGRKWRNRKDIRLNLLLICKEIVKRY